MTFSTLKESAWNALVEARKEKLNAEKDFANGDSEKDATNLRKAISIWTDAELAWIEVFRI